MIRELLQTLLRSQADAPSFDVYSDSQGLNLFLPERVFQACARGEGEEWLLNQFIALQMLVEEGIAQMLPNGFLIPSEDVVRLEEDLRFLLQLPDPWIGKFSLKVHGQTTHPSFTLQLCLVAPNGEEIPHYRLQGPFLYLSELECYLPTPEQWVVLKTVADHQALAVDERSEYCNLQAVHQLQEAYKAGAEIDLSHFQNLHTVDPEKVSVSMQETEDGGLLLVPAYGEGIAAEAIEKRLGQIGKGEEVQSLRVEDKIVLLDEMKLEATQEIIRNRHIPAKQVRQFFETPSAFLDASLVDLDIGFSLRVKGATAFKHGYFGETDASGIEWFERLMAGQTGKVLLPEQLGDIIRNAEDLREFRQAFQDAQAAGAGSLAFGGIEVAFEDPDKLVEKLNQIEVTLQEAEEKEAEGSVCEDPELESQQTTVVDIEVNDEILSFGESDLEEQITKHFYMGDVKWENYKREPYPHQEDGIRWILGLNRDYPPLESESLLGSLLADDMGLGKTYMSLVAIGEYYQWVKEKGESFNPVLVVAPLTLLDTWKEEVEKTYAVNPFKDLVVLQADADLPRYRLQRRGAETRQVENARLLKNGDPEAEDAVRYSLKLGREFAQERLDVLERLVLTTYQTLRDYQFSLCRIPWSFVIFDEAQNIKNPNALQTRAAKGLKAEFKLLMTGTPVENHLGEFWCLFDTARPGLLGAYQDFRKTYMSPITRAKPEQVQETRLRIGRRLRSAVGELMLRRLKEGNLEGLPEKYILVGAEQKNGRAEYVSDLACAMEGEQLNRYEMAINLTIEALGREKGTNPVLRGLQQLRDISLHPRLMDGGMLPPPKSEKQARDLIDTSAKLRNLLSILDEIREREEKAIVFLVNKRLQRFLKVALQKIYGIPVDIINGDTRAVARKASTPTRTKYIRDFEARPGFGILIMSPVAAGVGLTVTAANNVIHLERHWNPAKEAQATDRVYRIGQDRDVRVYIPVLHHPEHDSFDVNLDRLLCKKMDLKDAVITPDEVTPDELYRSGLFGKTFERESAHLATEDVDHMPWSHFESLVAEIASQAFDGDVHLTVSSNDKGCDVVVLGEDQSNRLIQCKHTSKGQWDSELPMRELHGAQPFYESMLDRQFPRLMVFSNVHRYGKKARDAAKLYAVELMCIDDLDRLLKKHPVSEEDILRRLSQPRLRV